ncbi:acetylxylan esterase [Geminisphaera colitermitum]|uniref:acetylxylan esterase n=1 Tax=Geminisphaera colitermitum TaxID=1148786 RepID=UPI0001965112|nr:acetylxylan esterase [Geminisphaera colitermitum]
MADTSGRFSDILWKDVPGLRIGGEKNDTFSGTVSLAWNNDGLLLRVRMKDDSVHAASLAVVSDPAIDAGWVFNHYDAIEISVGGRTFAFCPLEDGRVAYYYDFLERNEVREANARIVSAEDDHELLAIIPWRDIDAEPKEGLFLPLMIRIHDLDSDGAGKPKSARRIVLPKTAEPGVPVSYGAAFLVGERLPDGHAPRLEPLFGVRLETGAYHRRIRLLLTAGKEFGRLRVSYGGTLDGATLYRSSVSLGERTTLVDLPIGKSLGVVRLHMTAHLPGGEFGPVILDYFSPGEKALADYRGTMTPPEDFDAFWNGKLAELASIPMETRMEKLPESDEQTTLWKVRLTGWRGIPFFAFLAVPTDAGRHPLRMRVYPRVPVTTAKPERGKVVLAVSPRGLGPSSEFSPPPQPASQHRSESGSPEDLYMLANILDWIRAIDHALTLPQVDASRVHVSGGSRGGYLALALAAVDSRITSTYAAVPAYADVELSASTGKFPDTRQIIYGGSAEDRIRQRFVWSYFDAVNLAHRIRSRILVEAGMQDNICPAAGIVDAFNRMPSREKILLLNPEGGHSSSPASLQMEAIIAGW